MSDSQTVRPLVPALSPEQRAARYPLVDGGTEILLQLYRAIAAAPEGQKVELTSLHRRCCTIWNRALAEPVDGN